jgi:hypothetical protein
MLVLTDGLSAAWSDDRRCSFLETAEAVMRPDWGRLI